MLPAQSANRVWRAMGKRCHVVSLSSNVLKHGLAGLGVVTYPGDLVVHAGEAEVHPVGDGGAGDEEAACHGDVGAALCVLCAHLGLVSRDRA